MRTSAIIAGLSMGLVSACASVQYDAGPAFLGSEQHSERNYTINEETSAFVGNPMIRVQDYRIDRFSSSEVEIVNDFYYNGFGINTNFRAGERYRLGGRTILDGEEHQFFVFGMYGILFDQSGALQDSVLNLSAYPPVYLVYSYETDGGPGSVQPVVDERTNIEAEGQNYEIIYSGRDENSIRMSYREYTDANLARQSFFQDLTYPASSQTIRFRDIVIQVYEANSEQIRFSVTADDTTSE
ncbi:hypothetical protein [Hyphobacterium marinum]|uniref:Lipoprotein n=1 Tax=Hyphobacterium marinum TaxID=3116574 RepID=A0ABU7M1P4_9PROT|nr:hypothetical protein [Hyphobacterium sp. Y6023]MEE2567749.1 hypothetical protein [Hyphobacterium sp. Y6023]